MEKTIKAIVLTNNKVLVSQIDEVGADVGEPDCKLTNPYICLLYTSPSPRDATLSRMPSSA